MFEVNSQDTRKTAAQKLKFSIKYFFSKYDQILSLLRIWSHLLMKSLMENFGFCAGDASDANDVVLCLYCQL